MAGLIFVRQHLYSPEHARATRSDFTLRESSGTCALKGGWEGQTETANSSCAETNFAKDWSLVAIVADFRYE